jgi:NADH-quinone oxidoreductase subunit B
MAVGLPENVFLTKLDAAASWARKNSLWPMPFATACCGIELMATAASRHDIARFGAEVMRFSPRQCDLLIVAGRVVMKMLPVLQRIWLQMPEPKWCMSMGACACTGGVFDTYAVVQGVDRFIPVDVYVPGCPPRPEQLLAALIEMQDKIQRTGTITGREFKDRTTPTGPPRFDPDEIRRLREAAPVAGLDIYNPPTIDIDAEKPISRYPAIPEVSG